ncbi:MAG: phosphatidylserine decarboxylase family protein [Bacteroidales bacterium]|nr:phosphatidylserine decarboxylase family protein [Bacteroidales bacterium]
MYIHKEGYRLLGSTFLIFTAITVLMAFLCRPFGIVNWILVVLLYGFWLAMASFFRIPRRQFTEDATLYIAPADGTICNIEQVFEKEYLNCDSLMVSIFMNVDDVHVNRYPTNGMVEYTNHHKGNYFVASYPKSSLLNERTSIGMMLDNGQRLLLRQVAGAVARRIVCYAKEGERAKQNDELGFIKFGSRVDLYLPLGTELNVKLNDKVKNGISVIGRLQKGASDIQQSSN